jgi:DUF1365 family protein
VTFASALYRGHLVHARNDHRARRVFRYPVFMAAIDPAELPALHDRLRLFSYNRPNLFSLYDRDYQDATHVGVAAAHTAALHSCQVSAPDTTRLITNLRVAHYVFNPVSFFLAYRAGALDSVVAEVNNTYGGRLRYILAGDQRIPAHPGRDRFRHHRDFFVSPFLHGDLTYDFDLATPLDGDHLDIRMHVTTTDGTQVFFAQFSATRTPLSDRSLAAAALRYPLMTAQVIGLIHLEALRLRALGVPYRRPGPDHKPLADSP